MKNIIRKSLKYSFLDGAFFSVMFGFGDTYFNPYAIAMKATSFQIGLLSSLPGLVSSLFQIKIPDWTDRVGRSRMISWGVFLQAALWIPVIFIPYVFPQSPASWLVLMVTLYLLMGAFAAPAWGSIMSQYLPAQTRGKYFSWRSRIHGTIALASTFLAGYILYLFPRQSLAGFAVLFGVAMLCRFCSWYYLTRMHEPKLKVQPEAVFTLRDFLSRARESNFVKFVFFIAGTSFAVSLAAPFFTVYMLRELKFDYLSFTVINMSPAIATLLTLATWGKYTDRAGCISVLRLTSLLVPIVPVLWLFSSDKIYLIIIQLFSGFAWAGFNLATSNFIFDAVSEPKRVRCISYFNLINGLGIFAGATLGGYLATRMPKVHGSALLAIFLFSGLMRLFVRAVFFPMIREVKKVEKVSTIDLFFRVTGTKPLIGIVQDALRIG